MQARSPSSAAKAVVAALVDACRRSIQGAIFSIWVPPAVTFVMVAFLHLYKQLVLGKLPVIDILLASFMGGLAMAGTAFLVGAMMLAVWGVPVLFFFRLLQVDHPLVASVAAAALTFGKFVVSPTSGSPFSDDYTMFVVVAAITGYAAGVYARFRPRVEKDGPGASHHSS